MRKLMKTAAAFGLTAIVSAAMAVPVLAAGWQTGKIRTQDWKYLKPNGSFACGWEVIDSDGDGIGKYYWFDQAGWLKVNDVTPDGYTVNENGEWVEDGVVKTIDMAEAPVKENDIADMPKGPFKLTYLVYNYGDKVGVLDKTTQSILTLSDYDKNSITLYNEVQYNDGGGFMFYREFQRQKNGTFIEQDGDSNWTLTWDTTNKNFTLDDEERFCVYDLVTAGGTAEE